MHKARSIRTILLLMAVLTISARGESLTDPYRILEKHFEAIGGFDRLKAQRTVYQEGTIRIEGAGLEGTFVQWSQRPLRLRQEVDLGVVTSISGVFWTLYVKIASSLVIGTPSLQVASSRIVQITV